MINDVTMECTHLVMKEVQVTTKVSNACCPQRASIVHVRRVHGSYPLELTLAWRRTTHA